MLRTASCCCRNTSIEVEGDPKIHLVCHCNNCKQRTGSAFGISAYFADIQIKRKQGETAIYAIDNDSTQQGRHFASPAAPPCIGKYSDSRTYPTWLR